MILADLEIEAENSDNLICSHCSLEYQEKIMIGPCGHLNICGQCIETALQLEEPKCPTCGRIIGTLIRFQ